MLKPQPNQNIKKLTVHICHQYLHKADSTAYSKPQFSLTSIFQLRAAHVLLTSQTSLKLVG